MVYLPIFFYRIYAFRMCLEVDLDFYRLQPSDFFVFWRAICDVHVIAGAP